MAAQAIVRESVIDPLPTWSTNIIGTANLLEIARESPSIRAIVVVTSDKVYADNKVIEAYDEDSELGGETPYNASKACAELVCSCYANIYKNEDKDICLATVRAGNVIGGGDWSKDRIIPDIVKANFSNDELKLRFPTAVRPWQHVLDCLSGYLVLAQKLARGDTKFIGPWNFGPDINDCIQVQVLLEKFKKKWPKLNWDKLNKVDIEESVFLKLDNSKAIANLDWKPVWELSVTIAKTIDWYDAYYKKGKIITIDQIIDYERDAVALNNRGGK